MVRLRSLDRAGRRAYLAELIPRFLVLKIRAKGVHLRWAVPSWALEEILRFALRVAPLVPAIVRILPEKAARSVRRFAPSNAGRNAWAVLDAFFSEEHRDLLVLPPGEPLVAIEASDVHIRIEQTALGVRA